MGDDDGPHNGHTGSNSTLNSESTATSSEKRYRVPKICDRAESVLAEAGVRLKFDWGPAVACQAPENAENWAPGQTSILLGGGAPRGMRGCNDHVFRPDYCPNLDHLD
jgi:hypothetical protein